MRGNRSLGEIVDDLIPGCPQYRVAGRRQNHFKLCDFPLVSLISLLY